MSLTPYFLFVITRAEDVSTNQQAFFKIDYQLPRRQTARQLWTWSEATAIPFNKERLSCLERVITRGHDSNNATNGGYIVEHLLRLFIQLTGQCQVCQYE
jgi:hypothetical protein